MRKALAIVVVLAALVWALSAQAKEDWRVHKGATGLTWLTHPAHGRMGTVKSRAKAYRASYRRLFDGLRSVGFLSGALCIHGYEGSWQDPNAPFWGGMQMDYGFQQSYGLVFIRRWGTADRWPVWAQLYASYKAWLTRGWYPWPNTARYCGLI